MGRIKNWLIHRFLPIWARERLLADNERLTDENKRLRAEVERLDAYIDGVESGLRAQRRIIINTGEGSK